MDFIRLYVKPNGTKFYESKINLDGAKIIKEKELEKKLKGNVVTLSPMQRLQNKINETIMQDLLTLEDDWIDGQEQYVEENVSSYTNAVFVVE